MGNPYEVLGLSPDASLDDVKRAYRDLARLYNNDFQKMDELNAAYDAIVMNLGSKQKSTSYADAGTDYSYASADNYTGDSKFGDIRAKLNGGRIDDAEMLLDGIPYKQRDAEWFYLKGTIQHRRGWLESAAESFERAHRMDPENPEYKAAFKQLNREKKGDYRREHTTSSAGGCCNPCGCDGCDICTGLCCADCCCECLGGDLIRCC
ncbi:MAG: DnaJ domain-containing protein [Clostridia bacterium]|nr:DnaJ domain-containing protein [Clostridia bacterium]